MILRGDYLANTNGIPFSDSNNVAIQVPIGKVDINSIIEVECSGTIINASGGSSVVRYWLGYKISGKSQSFNTIVSEQTAMANNAVLQSMWKYKYTGGLSKTGTVEAFRTVPASPFTNSQVTLTTMFVAVSPFLSAGNFSSKYEDFIVVVGVDGLAGNKAVVNTIKVIVYDKVSNDG